jgi:hypothetical protein
MQLSAPKKIITKHISLVMLYSRCMNRPKNHNTRQQLRPGSGMHHRPLGTTFMSRRSSYKNQFLQQKGRPTFAQSPSQVIMHRASLNISPNASNVVYAKIATTSITLVLLARRGSVMQNRMYISHHRISS